MKINKFKLLLIAICCLVISLWTEVQCMEYQIKNDVPTGSIVSFSGEIAPDGWLLCDGKQYTSQNYPELYEVVKEKYVPDSEQWVIKANQVHPIKIFHVPDLRGRVIVGVDNGVGRVTTNNTLGASDGEEKVVITINEIPEYDISIPFSYNGHSATSTNMNGSGITVVNHYRETLVSSRGNNQPHNNMQPYQVLNYIINVGKNDELQQLRKEINELKIAQQGCAKAWVVFKGINGIAGDQVGIIRGYGVNSVEKGSRDGSYVIRFTNPFPDENYCSILSAGLAEIDEHTATVSGPYLGNRNTGSFQLYVQYAHFNSSPSIPGPVYVSASFFY